MSTDPTPIQGTVAPGFEPVRVAFAENLARRRELGAACALVHEGRTLVDLWGGVVDPHSGTPWRRETVVLLYSVSKGLAAAALAWLQAQGRLDYEACVAELWPAFGARGKERITLRQLLAHQAGLAGIDARLDAARLADLDALAPVLAAQRPAWPPGTRHAYHAMSLGFYQNEIARRVDEHGRTIGAIVRDVFAGPLGEPLSIGLPPDTPLDQIAPIEPLNPWRLFLHPTALSPRFGLALAWPWSLTARSIRNPRLKGPSNLDDPPWRRVELPSSNGYGTARGIAALYASLAGGGTTDLGIAASTRALLAAPVQLPPAGESDAVFKRRTAFALGFMKPSTDFRFGSDGAAFGAPGVGGSFGYADPATRSGYAYVTNRLGFNVFDDPREKALRKACVQAMREARA